jgi:predicted KAP-like P-loop ATPase
MEKKAQTVEEKYFNDAPIVTPEDDRFGIDHFAQALARSISGIKLPIGSAIALSGPWGSGKSSAVNLIRYHLKDEVREGKLDIIDFKCWWFRGEEALTLAFLQELNGSLRKSLGDKVKELIPRIGKSLLQAGPVIGPVMNLATGGFWGAITSGSFDFAKRFFREDQSIEKLFQQLSKVLEEQNKRFLVVIDDIDRLTPEEALLIFRLVKSVGRLPNMMYLLVFDRELAEKAVKEKYPSEGPHFLEKIIQAYFEIPLPTRDDLNAAVLHQIENICGNLKDEYQLRRFMNIFYDAISPHLNTARDLVRLSNSMAIGWPAVAKEVDVADFVTLEVMRLFQPALYNAIRMNKDRVCGLRPQYGKSEDPEKELQYFLRLVPENHQANAKLAMMRLFPRFEITGYSSSFVDKWEAERLVCTEKHFDTYFRMAIGNETLSAAEIDEFVERSGDREYIIQIFRKALNSIRKNGKSKVPLLLDELNVHASRIEKENFISLISSIFEIADDIFRYEDCERGGFSIGDNYLRIHWLIRKLTFDRCSIDERNDILLKACQNAQVGWLVDFTRSAISDHSPRNGQEAEPSDKCLVKKEYIDDLKVHTLKTIHTAAANGSLISHSRLPYILFQWRDLAEDDGAGVKAWTCEQLKNNTTLSLLARAFTGESWSQGIGMYGLGDRVSMRKIRAQIEGLESIIDVNRFRHRLEEVEKSDTLNEEDKRSLSIFLEAWRKRESGEDR